MYSKSGFGSILGTWINVNQDNTKYLFSQHVNASSNSQQFPMYCHFCGVSWMSKVNRLSHPSQVAHPTNWSKTSLHYIYYTWNEIQNKTNPNTPAIRPSMIWARPASPISSPPTLPQGLPCFPKICQIRNSMVHTIPLLFPLLVQSYPTHWLIFCHSPCHLKSQPLKGSWPLTICSSTLIFFLILFIIKNCFFTQHGTISQT